MEISALYTPASHRGVEVAVLHIIPDDLSEFVWRPAFGSEVIARVRGEIERVKSTVGEIIKEIP